MMTSSVQRDRCIFVGRSEGPVEGVRCDRPLKLLTPAGEVVHVRCRASDRSMCEPCGETYRRNVARVATGGVMLPGRTYLLTLTAPGDREHFKRNGERCECTPAGGVELSTWNGRAVDRWNDLHRALSRSLGLERFEYFKAVEVQRRGALHLHVLVRVPAGCRWTVTELRRLAIRHGYGHSVDLRQVEGEKACWYVAKYVSKASGCREDVPYVNPRTGEVGPGRWRTWTASRRWGASMASVRADQASWWASRDGDPPEADHGPPGPLDPNGLRYAQVPPSGPGSLVLIAM